MNVANIRNFSIIAHVNHGKSTIADRILEQTGSISKREMKEQYLDNMDIERERGITIKSQTVCLNVVINSNEFIFNLIDTPGHVDFGYEVSRSLSACEGALLVVDAVQGIEAQTLSTAFLALKNNIKIIPVINKIDLPNANLNKVKNDIANIIGIDTCNAVLVSGKYGSGIDDLLVSIAQRIPAPVGMINNELQALVFDSWFDSYKGIIVLVKIVNGIIKKGNLVRFIYSNKSFVVQEIGVFTPHIKFLSKLSTGEVGFVVTNIKEIKYAKVGDTIVNHQAKNMKSLIGFNDIKPNVFAGIFPNNNTCFNDLRTVLEKLSLNDASLIFEHETSTVLGLGFRCGFLGLLHMDVIIERLEREFHLDLVITFPTVMYNVFLKTGRKIVVDNPICMPDSSLIDYCSEPYVLVKIYSPVKYIGGIIALCQNKRGLQINIDYLNNMYVMIYYELPLSEVIFDFFNKLKSLSQGYASFNYELLEHKKSELVKVDILLNHNRIDALSFIVHKSIARKKGKLCCTKIKDLISRQQFSIAVQASINNKIIVRENVSSLRKNVTSKCYGGDITRKRKLLEKQKKGKKKMKQIGNVKIPHSLFLSLLTVYEYS